MQEKEESQRERESEVNMFTACDVTFFYSSQNWRLVITALQPWPLLVLSNGLKGIAQSEVIVMSVTLTS